MYVKQLYVCYQANSNAAIAGTYAIHNTPPTNYGFLHQ